MGGWAVHRGNVGLSGGKRASALVQHGRRQRCQVIFVSIVGSQSERIKRSSGIGTGLAEPGPNKGPVIFRGMPKGPGQGGNNTVRNVLVTVETLPNAAVVPVTRAHPGFLRVQDQEREQYYRTVRLGIILFNDLPIQNF